MTFSIFNSWGPPVAKPLSNSDENSLPAPSIEKTHTTVKNVLKTSSGDTDKPRNVLKISSENIPAAAPVEPVAAFSAPKTYGTRFKLLDSTTDIMLSGIEMAHNVEVDARFPNIPCIQSSRIKDQTQRPRNLHANEVNFCGIKMICTQAPTSRTYSEFWNTVCDLDAIIVDLTNENDRSLEAFNGDLRLAATPYYPQTIHQVDERENLVVSLKKIEPLTNDASIQFTCSEYVVKRKDEERSVLRVNYSSWTDFHGIELSELIRLVEGIQNLQEKYGEKMLIIHCRAGMGRTGTLSTALAMLKMHKNNSLRAFVNTASGKIEEAVDQLILLGRVKRGKMFVSTVPQYILLHDYMAYLLGKASP